MLVEKIARAIARMEGYEIPGSLAQRNNNPGNLRSWGKHPKNKGFVVFPSPDAGWAALRRQVRLNIARGLTLEEFFAGKPGVYGGYAPAGDKNDPAHYAQVVGSWAGIPINAPLQELDGTMTAGEKTNA